MYVSVRAGVLCNVLKKKKKKQLTWEKSPTVNRDFFTDGSFHRVPRRREREKEEESDIKVYFCIITRNKEAAEISSICIVHVLTRDHFSTIVITRSL